MQADLTNKKVVLVKLRSVFQIILKAVLSQIKNGKGINIDDKRENITLW